VLQLLPVSLQAPATEEKTKLHRDVRESQMRPAQQGIDALQ
jgi:hypothetical protein